MSAKQSAVRTLLDTRLSRNGQRGAALGAMASDMVALALRGAPHRLSDALRRDLKKAVTAATGCDVEVTVMDEAERQFTRKQYPVDYADSLATRIRERHWSRLQSGFARVHGDAWETAKDEVWNALLADARPYGLTAWTDANDAPRNTPGENLLTALFYFVSYAALGDADAMEPLANLVRLLPFVVPIGEWRTRSCQWLFAVHPVL